MPAIGRRIIPRICGASVGACGRSSPSFSSSGAAPERWMRACTPQLLRHRRMRRQRTAGRASSERRRRTWPLRSAIGPRASARRRARVSRAYSRRSAPVHLSRRLGACRRTIERATTPSRSVMRAPPRARKQRRRCERDRKSSMQSPTVAANSDESILGACTSPRVEK